MPWFCAEAYLSVKGSSAATSTLSSSEYWLANKNTQVSVSVRASMSLARACVWVLTDTRACVYSKTRGWSRPVSAHRPSYITKPLCLAILLTPGLQLSFSISLASSFSRPLEMKPNFPFAPVCCPSLVRLVRRLLGFVGEREPAHNRR